MLFWYTKTENSIETQPTAFEKEYIEKLHELIKLDSELRSVLGYFGKDNIKDVLSDDTTRRILASAALYENPIPKDNALGEPDNNVMRVA